jgi:DNA-binding GntR family transcriptional regulator
MTSSSLDGTVGSRHRLLARAVLDELRSAIIAGEYPQGQRLVEEEIAARFDVSRNPIREALHTLSAEGFVELEPRRGARVAVIDRRRAGELFELRGPLEGLVCGLAARRRTPQGLADLRAIVGSAQHTIAAGRFDELPVLNNEFHTRLAELARNDLLANTLGHLSHIIRWLYAARISQRAERSWDEHAAIVDAVEAGDEALAEQRGRAHIAAASSAYELPIDPPGRDAGRNGDQP